MMQTLIKKKTEWLYYYQANSASEQRILPGINRDNYMMTNKILNVHAPKCTNNKSLKFIDQGEKNILATIRIWNFNMSFLIIEQVHRELVSI